MANGKKKNKKIKNKIEKLTFVEDAFYRLSVEDCERKIDRLQKHLASIETSNIEIQQKIHSLNYEQTDKAGDLTKSLRQFDETIYKYSEEIHVLSQDFSDIKSRGDATIIDLEDKYKAMHDQLTCEIKILKAKLKQLDEFRISENKVHLIIENEKTLREEKAAEYKNVIAQMKLRIQTEKEALQKEIETKLVQSSEEFTRSSALRDAAYAQRLIRENIALEKEIDILKNSQEAMDQQLKEHTARCKEIKENFSALIRKKRELIFVAQQKTNLIARITTRYEKLKNAYTDSMLYRSQYQDIVQYQQCKHFRQHQMVTQAKKLAARAHMLKSECHYLENRYVSNEKEIARLRDVMLLIRNTILNAACIYEKPPQLKVLNIESDQKNLDEEFVNSSTLKYRNEETEYEDENVECTVESKSKDLTLLETLLDMLEQLKTMETTTSTIETVTPNSFLLRYSDLLAASSDSLRECFKQSEVLKRATVYDIVDDTQLYKQDSKEGMPKERMERCLIFDVEKGTSFYASSSKPESVLEEHDREDFGDQESSYESLSGQEAEEKPISLPKSTTLQHDERDSKQHEFPPGSIVDVEIMEEGEEEEDEVAEKDTTSLDREKYTSNIDEEIDSVNEMDEPEDEMSVYMFY